MPSRRLLGSAVLLAVSAWIVPALASAQMLSQALCPLGSPFNLDPSLLDPPLTTFSSGQAGIPLLRRTIDVALYPEARCNDSSPAVMYIRPAHAAYNQNPIVNPSSKWLIFLDGGGGCHDADECLLDRWCGEGGEIFDRAGKMSSLTAPEAIRGFGIFASPPPPGVVDRFTEYNHVLVHYCSSDNWIGSARLAGINTSTGIAYDIELQGEAIVNAVIQTLLAGPVSADPPAAAHFYGTALPDLSDATEIVLAGESAGGGGLRHHLDRLNFDVLRPAIGNPQLQVRGLVDAGAPPGLWDPAISWADPYSPADYPHNLLTQAEPPVRSFWGANDSALDQSCLDPAWAPSHASHPRDCYDTTYTLMNHITTPVFLRQDINDPLGKQRYVDWALYPTNDVFWTAQYTQLGLFAGYTPAAGGLEPPLVAPGVQGIHCDRHVSIQTNDGFFAHHVVGAGLPVRSFHDLLVAWLANAPSGPNTVQIQTDALGAGAYSPSFCP